MDVVCLCYPFLRANSIPVGFVVGRDQCLDPYQPRNQYPRNYTGKTLKIDLFSLLLHVSLMLFRGDAFGYG